MADIKQQTQGTRFFAILMPWGRVGSNLVTAALATSGHVKIDNEPTTRISTLGHNDGLSRDVIGQQQFAHLRAFKEHHQDADTAVGLKLSHRSLMSPRKYLKDLVDADFRLVVMLRSNFLKCAVSQLRALDRAQLQTNWQSPWAVARTEPKPGPTRIDPDEAIRLFKVFKKHQKALLDTVACVRAPDAMQIEYSRLAADPEATIRDVFSTIGMAQPERIRIPHKKATSDDLADDITNYPEFAQRVRDAGLDAFLEPEL